MLDCVPQLLAGYLVGGIPFGYLIAKARAGIDIRQHGSGNIGATNVGRVLGSPFFLVVFALDFLKGAAPVAAAVGLAAAIPAMGSPDFTGSLCPPLVGLAAILGHMFPLYLRFRGGKGVATSMGVILLLAPVPAALGLFAWGLLVLLTRMVSAGSIGFAIVLAIGYWCVTPEPFAGPAVGRTLFVLLAAVLIVARHHANLARIVRGTEARISFPWRR